MIHLRTILNSADNSGAKKFMVIGIPGRLGKVATVGQIVNAVVRGADPNGSVADHEKVKVVIVRTRKEIRRNDGTYVRFDDNAGVVVDKQGMPKGTRILGPVAREVKNDFSRIGSMAREVV